MGREGNVGPFWCFGRRDNRCAISEVTSKFHSSSPGDEGISVSVLPGDSLSALLLDGEGDNEGVKEAVVVAEPCPVTNRGIVSGRQKIVATYASVETNKDLPASKKQKMRR